MGPLKPHVKRQAYSLLHYALLVGASMVLLALAIGTDVRAAAIALVAGWLSGSLCEYAVHRFVLHGPRVTARIHALHHQSPGCDHLDPFSYFGPIVVAVLAWLVVYAGVAGIAAAHAFTAGLCLQYSFFRAVHRRLHIAVYRGASGTLARYHDEHHRVQTGNFGVTTRMWDRVFGTQHAMPADASHDGMQVETATAASQSGLPVRITDPCPRGDAPRNPLERACLPWLSDTRDLAFVRLALRATVTLVPFVAALFVAPSWLAWALMLPYLWVLYAVLGGPVLLMVHALTHRASFVGRGAWLRRYICHGLPLLYGLSPFAYQPHHVLMHHAEENRSADLSSTLAFTRDNWVDFLRYYLHFLFLGNFELARYLRAHAQLRARRRFIAGEICHLAAIVALFQLAPAPTVVAFILPYALTRFFLMAGNWAQHAFADAGALDDGVRNATILVNARHNRRCFNDGYHALHHRRPGLHWGDMSASFQRDWRAYADAGVIVFDGIPSNQVVWWRLMRRDYDYLADRMLDFGATPAGREERIAFLRQRAHTRAA